MMKYGAVGILLLWAALPAVASAPENTISQIHPAPPKSLRTTFDMQCEQHAVSIRYFIKNGIIAEAPVVLVDGRRIDGGNDGALARLTVGHPVDYIRLKHCGMSEDIFFRGRLWVILSKSWSAKKGVEYIQGFDVLTDKLVGPSNQE